MEDLPLHKDVRLLSTILGRVIKRLEGEESFQAVERLRILCRARRQDVKGLASPDLKAILSTVNDFPLETAAMVARAFALFFLLINTAEQVDTVRRRRKAREKGLSPQPGTYLWAMKQLKGRGLGAEEVADALTRLDVRPVLTAHPTEATRRSVLDLQARIAESLVALGDASLSRRQDLEERIESEVELLWLTAEVRRDRPSVMEEVSSVLWYLEHRLLEAETLMVYGLRGSFEAVFGRELKLPSPLKPGSWVGGDRDGNPEVTPSITLETARVSAATILRVYELRVQHLMDCFSISSLIKPVPAGLLQSLERDRLLMPEVWKKNQGRHRHEPVRLKLSFVLERLGRTRMRIEARGEGREQGSDGAYTDASAFEADLLIVQEALRKLQADHARRTYLDPLMASVLVHGFFGYSLDIREDSGMYRDALLDISRTLELPLQSREDLERELLGRRPLLSEHLHLQERTWKTVGVFRTVRRIQQELGERAASTCIVSMTHSVEDLLRVLLLGRENGLVDLAEDPPYSGLDVVPLFETLEDLKKAPEIISSLFASPSYQRQLKAREMRQEVMIGYSDSTKDAGILPASWALYCAQEDLNRICKDAGVKLTFFHGRGGTVGRGGGSPVFRALSALPPGSVEGRIKITEQGEVISQKYGLVPIAEHSIEVMISGALLVSFTNWCGDLRPKEEQRFREVMGRMAAVARPVYRKMVHEDGRLFRLFLRATPVRELTHVHFGSRPAYRERGTSAMDSIRAIPWVFGWTQVRLNLPAWLGVGTALSAVAKEKGGLALLRRMSRNWCFFDDLLGKIEMICAKTDLEIARAYIEHLSDGDMDLYEELAIEFRRTVESILQIRQANYLLADQPLLQTAVSHRDQYIDPLSILQIDLLRRKAEMDPNDPAMEDLNRAIGATLNGVAQGLKNTG